MTFPVLKHILLHVIHRFLIDSPTTWWGFSHMETTLVKADDKGRVSIRGTRKGAKYLVTAESGGWWVIGPENHRAEEDGIASRGVGIACSHARKFL